MYSISETAEILGVSYNLCRGLIKAGTLKSVVIGTRHKVSDEFIKDFLKNSIYAPELVFVERKRGRKPKEIRR